MISLKLPKIILSFTILFFVFLSTSTSLFLLPPKPTFAANCKVETNSTVEKGKELKVTVKNTIPGDYTLSVYLGDFTFSNPGVPPIYTKIKTSNIPAMDLSFTIPVSILQNEGKYTIFVVDKNNNFCDPASGTLVEVTPSSGPISGQNPCIGGTCETAIGNISTDIGGFASKILGIGIGLAGGIALILMVIGSIRVLTSSGDQQRLAGGRDMIIAAIAGLLFLVFSLLILEFIGVKIIGLWFGGFSAP